MREIGRVQQGYFPTQERIVPAIARLFTPPASGVVTILDAGCGCGDAIVGLRSAWLKPSLPHLTVRCSGIESDRSRYEQADRLFRTCGGAAVWGAIEDCDVDEPPSVLFFNPPYDRIRGAGRQELLLFKMVCEWVMRNGHLIMIVPDYVLADRSVGLAAAVERSFKMLGVYRYPEPEYKDFKQCVLIAQRRERALNKSAIDVPMWSVNPAKWPELPIASGTNLSQLSAFQPIQLISANSDVEIRRVSVSREVLEHVISKSPLRSSLLREAMAPPPPVERPLLPLRDGHLALALAGGLCDGVIEDEESGNRFLVKGSLDRATLKTGQKDKFDREGELVGYLDIMRTVYKMNVRCLRDDGVIETHSSHDKEQAATDAIHAKVEEDDDDGDSAE